MSRDLIHGTNIASQLLNFIYLSSHLLFQIFICFFLLLILLGLPGLRPLASISPSSATFLTSNNSPVGVQWPRLQASRKEPSVPALTRAFSSASSAWAPICAVGASRLLEQSPFDPRMITVRGLKPHPNKPFGERIVRRRKMRVCVPGESLTVGIMVMGFLSCLFSGNNEFHLPFHLSC